jgi:hypothetical protein
VRECGLNSGIRIGNSGGSGEHGDEPSDLLKGEEFCWLSEKISASQGLCSIEFISF